MIMAAFSITSLCILLIMGIVMYLRDRKSVV